MSSRSATSIDWQQHFTSLADAIERLQQGAETTLSSFAGEQSDFIRFNSGKVRQIGSVSQGKLTLRLIDGARQAYSTLTVCGDLQQDLDDVNAALATLRESLRGAADDPHLLFDTSQWQRATQRSGKLPEPGGLLRTVAECAQGLDFVGFYAGGTIVRGFASTSGSRGWYEVDNFNFSWSLYDPSGRAIKTTYAGDDWSDAVFASKVEQAATRLAVLARTPRTLEPGRYRSYLAPAALAELLGVTAWSGFSARAQASSRSELYKLHVGEIVVDPRVTISEDLNLGITPGFNDDGYLRESVPLIQAGRSAERLTNARSARIGNLWYVNFSDRMNCRLTGMTRFATFWVENGQIVAPLEAMRFDDSLYRLLGSELEQLGAQAELLLSDSTWGERATGGMQLPGILARSFELTL